MAARLTKWRLHRYCRTCSCAPGEFGVEICDICKEEFYKQTTNQVMCGETCRRIRALRRQKAALTLAGTYVPGGFVEERLAHWEGLLAQGKRDG